jgi:hypothetical protein
MNGNVSHPESGPSQPPPHAPADYGAKLKEGVSRLRDSLQERYEQIFPDHREQVGRAVATAEAMAWTTPFPALYLSALVHLNISEIYPQITATSVAGFQS